MKTMKKEIAICVAGAMLVTSLVGCSSEEAVVATEVLAAGETVETPQMVERAEGVGGVVTTSETAEVVDVLSLTVDDQFSNKDYEIGCIADAFVTVTLADGGSTASDGSVVIDGDTITITSEGAYLLAGSLSNGQIVVDADESAKVQLSLDGVQLFNDATAPIYVVSADKVFVTTTSGSDNYVTATLVEDEDSNVDSAIFSKADVTLNGAGSLTVSATNGNGITSKDDLAITSGTYTITAGNHGLEANNSIRIAGGTFSITSQKDGLHSEHDEDPTLGYIYIANGNLTIDAQGDGMDASGQIQIDDGVFDIVTAGGHENAPEVTSTMGGGQMQGGMTSQMGGQMQGGMGGMAGGVSNSGAGTAQVVNLAGGGGQMGGQMQGGMQSGMGTMPEMGEMPEMTEGQVTERPEMGEMGEMPTMVTVEVDESLSAKGIKAGTAITLYNGTFTLDTYDDGIHGDQTTEIHDGSFVIAAGDDAIRADMTTTIHGGTMVITACYEGIEGETVILNGGDIDITSSDDGINATRSDFSTSSDNISITINGGTLVIDSYNAGDGLDSNGQILVTGGDVLISSTTVTTDTALDYGGSAIITGGTFLVAGSNSQTTQNFEEGSTQGSIYVELPSVSTSTIILADSTGAVVAEYTPVKEFQALLISTPDIAVGEPYTLIVGDYTETIVMESYLYGEGNEGGMGGGGQMQGGMGGR